MSTVPLGTQLEAIMALLAAVTATADPLRQAQLLGEAQRLMGWLMRDVVLVSRADHSIRTVAAAVSTPTSVLHRQLAGPGPVLVSDARPRPKREPREHRISSATPLAS